LIDEDNFPLPVGQLAELWGLFARSHLLYGSEVWSTHSASALEKLEVTQAMAGRQILGKKGASNIIREAVLGDLGWMSVKSHLRLAKLRMLGRLLLSSHDSLAKEIFLTSKAQFGQNILVLAIEKRPSCWCNDVYSILQELGITSWWTHGLPSSLKSLSSLK
jgi:hypothetical protein